MKKFLAGAAVLAVAVSAPAMAITTSLNNNANALATALVGSGVNLLGSSLTTTTQNGFFSGGTAGTGIDNGVILTTGGLNCAGSTNTTSSCGTANGSGSSLTLTFTTDADNLFFNYVFASEEYLNYANSQFNDSFQLVLNGVGFSNVNLAQLPGGAGAVTINNVNLDNNVAFYRNNRNEPSGGTGTSAPSLNLPIEYDGLTTVLTAAAYGLTSGATYTLTFSIQDVGDSNYDSAVFIQGGTFSTVETPVPEPAMLGLFGMGAIALGLTRRRRTA